jgi:hypothetical protein
LDLSLNQAEGEELVRSAVGQILGTLASTDFTQGESSWRPELGSALQPANNVLVGGIEQTVFVRPRVALPSPSLSRHPARS